MICDLNPLIVGSGRFWTAGKSMTMPLVSPVVTWISFSPMGLALRNVLLGGWAASELNLPGELIFGTGGPP
jgi:hypothetical protein